MEIIRYEYICGYKVLEDGTVLNKNGTVKKWSGNGRGYLISRINFFGRWITIAQHTMVTRAFLGDRPDGWELNHKDNNKHNNALSNLEYLSKEDNRLQMYADGRNAKGTNNANCKYTEEQIAYVCCMLQGGFSYNIITNDTGVSKDTIGKIKRKQQWKDISEGYSF